MKLEAKLLEYAEKSFKGNDGKDVAYAEAVVRTEEGRMMKLSVAAGNDLTPLLDQDVVLEVSIFPDFQMKPKVKVVGVEKAKKSGAPSAA